MKAEHILAVHETQSGLKLLCFLERCLGLPSALLHRWLRTGQIRLNGGRVGPFVRVNAGDSVRLPPFALDMVQGKDTDPKAFCPSWDGGQTLPPPPVATDVSKDLAFPSLSSKGCEGDIWALYKPSGLPTHGGTGHSDSLASRLAALYAGSPFLPTPAHRLDKDTSGLLLVAASYTALRTVHDFLREGLIVKEYLAWVSGRWLFSGFRLLRHYLHKQFLGSREKILATEVQSQGGQRSREALCLARSLVIRPGASLLQIRLLTGRTHQIRAQLAALGYPVLGDAKYGGRRAGQMYLHAARIILPGGTTFVCFPPWHGEKSVRELPEAIPDSEIQAAVRDGSA